MIGLYVLLAAAAIFNGIEHGILWSRKGADAFTFNEHLVMVGLRACVFGAVVVAGLIEMKALVTVLAFSVSFPFWHNTAYYWSRHEIDPNVYPNWFTAQSTTSTAEINIGFSLRIILLVLSLTGLIVLL